MDNIDNRVVRGFGEEWSSYDQESLNQNESKELFDRYFNIFPNDALSDDKVGIDIGCGSGRWAKHIAPLVKELYCIDASEQALNVAKKNLIIFDNCAFSNISTDSLKDLNKTFDFGYSLGVLHHIPNTERALIDSVSVLKTGAPFLLYLYFAFDNKPFWYRFIWKISEPIRFVISRANLPVRRFLTTLVALFVYLPLSKFALFLDGLGVDTENFPLSSYKSTSFYTMRTDAFDRFGTRLEQRFTKKQILSMMANAGLINIEFSQNVPFWTALGYKK
jgi:SAM-dependent methyltransferase